MPNGFESWSVLVTARVRSTREGNIYTWECLSVHHCGGGVPHPRSGWGGTPSQVWPGGTSSQVWPGGTHPRSGQGVPHPRSGGVPGYPLTRSGWEGTWGTPYLDLRWGNPPHLDLGWGTPLPRPGTGYPLPRPEMGYPPT